MCFHDLPLYFENTAGQVREHPLGYGIVCYHAGQRQGSDLATLLTHAGELLHTKGWNRLLSDQRLMAPYTPAEEAWVKTFWATQQAGHPGKFWLAVVGAPSSVGRVRNSQ